MASSRASDVALLLGHIMQCGDCQERFLSDPQRALIGRKVTDEQRERLLALQPEDFESSTTLAKAAGLDAAELIEMINHPRARLRHL